MGNQSSIRQPSSSAKELVGTSSISNGTFNNQNVSVIRHQQLIENINNISVEQKGNYINLPGNMQVNVTEGVATLTVPVPANYVQTDNNGNWQLKGKLNIVDGNGNLQRYYNNQPIITLQADAQKPGQFIMQAQFKRRISFSEHLLSNNYSVSYNSMNTDKGFTGMIGIRFDGKQLTPWAGVGVGGLMGKAEIPLNKDFSKNPEAALLSVGVVFQQNNNFSNTQNISAGNTVTNSRISNNKKIVQPKPRTTVPQIRF
jgi:hypothetical protein